MDAEGFPRVQWNSTRWACVDCPYGTPGDRLWVREPWKTGNKLNALDAKGIAAKCLDAGYKQPGAPIFYLADGTTRVWGDNDYDDFGEFGRYRHARFMPRWASRITLEIAEVRVQRLQEIREEDSIAEGVEKRSSATWRNYHEGIALFYAKHSFYSLWESINGAGSWDANPWVWALTFKRLEAANA
jgi:hypothetical protein